MSQIFPFLLLKKRDRTFSFMNCIFLGNCNDIKDWHFIPIHINLCILHLHIVIIPACSLHPHSRNIESLFWHFINFFRTCFDWFTFNIYRIHSLFILSDVILFYTTEESFCSHQFRNINT